MAKKKHQHAFPNVNRADLKAAVDSGELPSVPDSGKRYNASSDPAMRATCGHPDALWKDNETGIWNCFTCWIGELITTTDPHTQEIQDQRSHAAGRL